LGGANRAQTRITIGLQRAVDAFDIDAIIAAVEYTDE